MKTFVGIVLVCAALISAPAFAELCSKRTKLFITSLPKLLQFSIGVLLWRNRMLSQA